MIPFKGSLDPVIDHSIVLSSDTPHVCQRSLSKSLPDILTPAHLYSNPVVDCEYDVHKQEAPVESKKYLLLHQLSFNDDNALTPRTPFAASGITPGQLHSLGHPGHFASSNGVASNAIPIGQANATSATTASGFNAMGFEIPSFHALGNFLPHPSGFFGHVYPNSKDAQMNPDWLHLDGRGTAASSSSGLNSRANQLFHGILGCLKPVWAMIGKGKDMNPKSDDWEISLDQISEWKWLGSGAQGDVYLGRIGNEYFAIKKVKDKTEADIKHLRKLNHPNIVTFKGVCIQSQFNFIVMEFCPFGQLFDVLKNGRQIPPPLVIEWTKQIASGMQYLHSHKIIHRDLKSPNVLLTYKDTLKISDFGTSRMWTERSTKMSFAGTVSWMAPEVIRNEPCSEKVDIWSFGVVLWELLTCEIPYKGVDSSAIIWGVGNNSLQLPIPSTIPDGFKLLLKQCWSSKPRNRPSFTQVLMHIDIAASELLSISHDIYFVIQASWKYEINNCVGRMKKGQSNNILSNSSPSSSNNNNNSVDSLPDDTELMKKKELKEAQHLREHYERMLDKVNNLYMEVNACLLQLEKRERQIRVREERLGIQSPTSGNNSSSNNKLSSHTSNTQSLNSPIGIRVVCNNLNQVSSHENGNRLQPRGMRVVSSRNGKSCKTLAVPISSSVTGENGANNETNTAGGGAAAVVVPPSNLPSSLVCSSDGKSNSSVLMTVSPNVDDNDGDGDGDCESDTGDESEGEGGEDAPIDLMKLSSINRNDGHKECNLSTRFTIDTRNQFTSSISGSSNLSTCGNISHSDVMASLESIKCYLSSVQTPNSNEPFDLIDRLDTLIKSAGQQETNVTGESNNYPLKQKQQMQPTAQTVNDESFHSPSSQ